MQHIVLHREKCSRDRKVRACEDQRVDGQFGNGLEKRAEEEGEEKMMGCMKNCFDENLPATMLAQVCQTTALRVNEPVEKLVATFTCAHGRRRRHSVYPGTRDWEFFSRLTPSGDVLAPEAA
jgi:hypothetical protein